MLHETEMAGYFQRQLADYVEYHRDPWNCAMHVVGILLLFTGAVLPLTLVKFPPVWRRGEPGGDHGPAGADLLADARRRDRYRHPPRRIRASFGRNRNRQSGL